MSKMIEMLDADSFIKSKKPSKKELERISQIIRELKSKYAKQGTPRGGNNKKKPSK